MLDIKIEDNKTVVSKYPYIGKSPHGRFVLFIDKNEGIELFNLENDKMRYSKEWCGEEVFIRYNGEIILKNK